MYLRQNRYDEIKQDVMDVYIDYGIKKFPVDVFALAHLMQIQLVEYSNFVTTEQLVLISASDDGMSYYSTAEQKFYIVYNSAVQNDRVRFTIAHEIGHIALGHTNSNEETESEADFFAQWLLVPEAVLVCKKITDLVEVVETFDVSPKCAGVCLNKLGTRLDNWGYSIFSIEEHFLKYLGMLGG